MRKEIKKIIAIMVTSLMVIGILPYSIFFPSVVFVATGFRHETLNSEYVVLGGNYIEVGISKSGSFRTKNAAPSGFHPSTVDRYQTSKGVGLRVDGDGFDTGNAPTTGDFLLPGDPEEGFAVGYKISSNSAAATLFTDQDAALNSEFKTYYTVLENFQRFISIV